MTPPGSEGKGDTQECTTMPGFSEEGQKASAESVLSTADLASKLGANTPVIKGLSNANTLYGLTQAAGDIGNDANTLFNDVKGGAPGDVIALDVAVMAARTLKTVGSTVAAVGAEHAPTPVFKAIFGAADLVYGGIDVLQNGDKLGNALAEHAKEVKEWSDPPPQDAIVAAFQQSAENAAAQYATIANIWNSVGQDANALDNLLSQFNASLPDGGMTADQWLGWAPAFSTALQSLGNDASGLTNLPNPTDVVQQLMNLYVSDFTQLTTVAGSGAGMSALTGHQIYAALQTPDGNVQRLQFDGSTGIDVFLTPNTSYTLDEFDPSNGSVGSTVFTSSAAGVDTHIPTVMLTPDTDTVGADGLTPTEAHVLGVDSTRPGNLISGMSDLAVLQQGLLGNASLVTTTGVVANLPLQGSAQSVVLAGSLTDSAQRIAYVATGSYGLAIVDVTNFQMPVLLGEIALQGDATDVAVDPALQVAVVADGVAGLRVVNIADPTKPSLVLTIPSGSTHVEVLDGIAYADGGSSLYAFDLASGAPVQVLNLGGTALTGMSRDGSTLYTMDFEQHAACDRRQQRGHGARRLDHVALWR